MFQLAQDAVSTIALLSSADAILGSQISNVFRLAAELHCSRTGYLTCGPLCTGTDTNATSDSTVWSIDLPWYQDP